MTDRQNAKHLRSEVLKADDDMKKRGTKTEGSRINTERKSGIQDGQRFGFRLPNWTDRRNNKKQCADFM